LFRPRSIGERVWRKLLGKVEQISRRERVRHDICLIGSHARGDASPLSDIDLTMFAEGESVLKQTDLFDLSGVQITTFPVDITRLLKAESVDFYSASNLFEAKLIHGEGRVLRRVREGVFGKEIDLGMTKKILGEALSRRLMSALGDVTLDYGEGVRDMRVCLAKAKLYHEIFVEKVHPWSIIPYRYEPEDELESLLDELYYSKDYEELSSKLAKADLGSPMMEAFGRRFGTMVDVVGKVVGEVGFAGGHVKSYIQTYFSVEERVRATVWSRLPGRWEVEERLKPKVNHDRTNISCGGGKVSWLVSTGEGDSLKLECYGIVDFTG
jgi:predicted nucleotidyltransferase